MTASEDWVEVVPPLRGDVARAAFRDWCSDHLGSARLVDDDVRIDLIRTTEGDRVRYLVRAETWRALFED